MATAWKASCWSAWGRETLDSQCSSIPVRLDVVTQRRSLTDRDGTRGGSDALKLQTAPSLVSSSSTRHSRPGLSIESKLHSDWVPSGEPLLLHWRTSGRSLRCVVFPSLFISFTFYPQQICRWRFRHMFTLKHKLMDNHSVYFSDRSSTKVFLTQRDYTATAQQVTSRPTFAVIRFGFVTP